MGLLRPKDDIRTGHAYPGAFAESTQRGGEHTHTRYRSRPSRALQNARCVRWPGPPADFFSKNRPEFLISLRFGAFFPFLALFRTELGALRAPLGGHSMAKPGGHAAKARLLSRTRLKAAPTM